MDCPTHHHSQGRHSFRSPSLRAHLSAVAITLTRPFHLCFPKPRLFLLFATRFLLRYMLQRPLRIVQVYTAVG